MSSTTLDGKRRRVESTSSGLSKPFKSPLRRPPAHAPTTPAQPQNDDHGSPLKKESSENHTPKKEANSSSHSIASTPPPTRPSTLSSSTTPTLPPTTQPLKRKSPSQPHLTPSKKPIIPPDPELLDLQKQQRDLQYSRLPALRSELDTLQQALKIESSAKDTELEALVSKWKGVSQKAAEEVFEGARERVARMGGMKAWRAQKRSQQVRWEEEEMEAWYGTARGEDLGGQEDDEEEVRRRREELVDSVEGATKGGKEEGLGDEDEEFTMDFMLKTLNIDLKVIGFDPALQRWVKE